MTEPCTVTGVLRDAAGDLLTSTKLSFQRLALLQAVEGDTVVAPVFGTALAAAETVTTDGTTGAFSIDLMPGVYRLSYQGGAGIEAISFAVPVAETRDLAILIGQATTIDSALIQTVLGYKTDAETARDKAQAWAEGTLPGGAGTKSAEEHAADAGAKAVMAAADASAAAASRSGAVVAGEAAVAASEVAVAAAAIFGERFVGSDYRTYDKWGAGILGPSDRGFWFDAADPEVVFSDLHGLVPASDADEIKLVMPRRSVANPEISLVTDPTMASGWTLSGVTAGTTTGSDGVSTVPVYSETAATTFHYVEHTAAIARVIRRRYIVRARVKLTNRTKLLLTWGSFNASFNLSTVAVISAAANTEARVVAAGNGYFDVSIAFIANTTTGAKPVINVLDDSGASNYLGSVSAALAVEFFDAVQMTFDGFAQSVATRFPTLADTAHGRALVPDGANDFLAMASLDLSGATKLTMAVVGTQDSVSTTTKILAEFGFGFGYPGFFLATDNTAPAGNLSAGLNKAAAYTIGVGAARAAETPFVFTMTFDPDEPAATELTAWIDGVSTTLTPLTSGSLAAADVFLSRTLALFARLNSTGSTGALFSDVKLHAMLLIDRALTADERNKLARTGLYRAGLDPSAFDAGASGYTLTPRIFSDAGICTEQSWGIETNPFASVEFSTDATELTVSHYNSLIGGAYEDYCQIGVLIDGAFDQVIEPTVIGNDATEISLPAGNKLVALVNGLTTKPSSTVLGTWVRSISADRPMQQVFRSSARMLVYGDSIAVGANADPVQQYGWVPRLRDMVYPLSVSVEGYGFRALHDDAVDEAARKVFVRKVMAYRPDIMWLAIGTNDYGLNKWSAASFGTAYADLLDKLHAALPGMRIYAQTPLLRTGETANGSGSTTGDYRTQIATAASSRAWATLVDGTSIMTTGDLADGVHPDNDGMGLYADFVFNFLGL